MIINDDEKSTRRLQKSARLSARRSARGQKSQKPQNPPPEKMEKQDPPSEKVKSQQAIEPEPKQEESPKEPNPSESTGESGGAGSTISHILKKFPCHLACMYLTCLILSYFCQIYSVPANIKKESVCVI